MHFTQDIQVLLEFVPCLGAYSLSVVRFDTFVFLFDAFHIYIGNIKNGIYIISIRKKEIKKTFTLSGSLADE